MKSPARKVRMTFLGARTVRIMIMSSVFRDKTYTYLLVRRGEKYNHYLRLHTGVVEVIRLGKSSEQVQRLVPYPKFPLKHAANVYLKSYLPKTDEAYRVIEAILSSDDDDQMNFLLDEDAGFTKEKLEKPTKVERSIEKANMVTLEKICQDLDLKPARVRAAFRRHQVKKPGTGWHWDKSEYSKIVKQIKEIL